MNTLRTASPHAFTGRVVLAVILVLIAVLSHVLALRADRPSFARDSL